MLCRFVVLALVLGCGRSKGVDDKELGNLVITPKPEDKKLDPDKLAKDPAELGRALMAPYAKTAGVLGPHELTIATETTVDEAGKQVSSLTDTTKLVVADKGLFHGTYENSADYGREVVFAGGKLYLRPRYQRWHERKPEAPDEPEQLRDQMADAIGATWDLLAPAIELTDRGSASVDGRAGKKIEVKLSPGPHTPPPETLTQRKWREQRSVDAVSGEIVIDADTGAPLSVKLAGTVSFSRDGKRYAMKVALTSAVSAIGKPAEVVAPTTDIVATPERRKEVDDRDYLLQGIAPPLRKNGDAKPAAAVKKP